MQEKVPDEVGTVEVMGALLEFFELGSMLERELSGRLDEGLALGLVGHPIDLNDVVREYMDDGRRVDG